MLRPVGGLNEYRYIISDIKVAIKDSKDNPVILTQNIRSFSILHDYVEHIIPVIQVTAAVEKDLYNLLTSTTKEISMQIVIHKYAKNSDVQAKELVVSKIFNVLNENDLQPDEMKTMYGDTENSTDNTISGSTTQQLMEASFYLVDNTPLSNYRIVKSLSISSASLTDAIAVMFQQRGFKSLLMNKIPADSSHPIYVPAFNLLSSLEYLDNRYGIFNTDYIFYMDISDTYLIDKTSLGKAVKDGKPGTVTLYLEEFSSVESADVGSIIKDDAYVINITEPPVVQKTETFAEYVDGTKITSVDTDGAITKFKGVIPTSSLEKTIQVFNKKAATQMQYNLKESRWRVGVNLLNIDINAIAPNLLYRITSHSKYQNVNPLSGGYRLNQAHVVLTKETDTDFVLRCNAMLVKQYTF
jgi:hypothetical protein